MVKITVIGSVVPPPELGLKPDTTFALVPDNMQQVCKVHYKKTRKGKVVQPVQEKYLRTDLGAGAHCGQVLSSSDLRELVAQAPHAHLLIVDTNIALHQVDVLEYNSPATSLIVIMQTVMQELKHLNGNVHGRIMELIKDPSRSFIFYANELSAHTATSRFVYYPLHISVYCAAKLPKPYNRV